LIADVLDRDRIESAIRGAGIDLGVPLLLLQETGSTNDVAATEALRGAAHGTLVIAERQTAGRGRLGRRWLSPAGQNLTFSLVLRPRVPIEQLATITLAIGLAVADAVSDFVQGVPVQVKWPNDVLIAHRKAVGILVESCLSGAALRHVIAGIGIDVLQTSFDPAIASIATSIAQHCTAPPARTSVLVAALRALSARLQQFERDGVGAMLEDLRRRDATLGARVRCMHGEGTGQGIEADGTLRVRLDDGTSAIVSVGDVELLG
jgi:BirA family transcriptional regulator, biotin operon repressor / biotin---[acetyl-CoA-carboxylase] ligase